MKKDIKLVVLLLITVLVYSNAFMSGFIADDSGLIVRKQFFFSRPGNGFKLLVSPDAPLGERTPYYRPLGTLTYMADHYLWGLNPFWYHLENVLIHALVVMLFYLLLAAVFKDRRLAFFAALLFAVYPVNAEAVDFVSARNELLCAAFSLASLLLLARGKKVSALLAYFLALLSKEPAVVLPFFLFSYVLTADGLAAGKEKIRKNRMAFAGFFAVTALYFAIRRLVLGVFTSATGIGFSAARLKLMASVYFEHFRLFIYPFMLNSDYTEKSLSFGILKAAGAGLGVFLLLYFSLARKTPAPLRAGAQWIFWGLLPVSNLVRIPSAQVAERYQYTIISGFAVVLGYLIAKLHHKRASAGVALMAALALAMGARTFERNFTWKDNLVFFQAMVRSDPANASAHSSLAWVYAEQGRPEDSIREAKKALALDPSLADARLNLGVAYAGEGRHDAAIREFRAALSQSPGDIKAWIDLGTAYMDKGDLFDAVMDLRTVTGLAPEVPEAHLALGMAYEKEGLPGRAAAQYRNVLELEPGNARALELLGAAKGRPGGK